MASHRCLGLYYRNGSAVAALVEAGGGHPEIAGVQRADYGDLPADQQTPAALLNLLQERIRQAWGRPAALALALDSQWYQSQSCQSQFETIKQVRQTLRYDIEEEFAIDAESVTVAYSQMPGNEPGMKLMVYTVNQGQFRELLGQFEKAQLDALAVEPDMESWRHWLLAQRAFAGQSRAALTRAGNSIYLLMVDEQGLPVVARSFVVPAPAEWTAIATEEFKRSALAMAVQPQTLYYHPAEWNSAQVAELSRGTGFNLAPLPAGSAEEIFAAGAAIGYLAGQCVADFRLDNLPSQTVRTGVKRAGWALSTAVSLFMLVWMAVAWTHGRQYDGQIRRAAGDVDTAWRKAIPNERPPRANMDKNLEACLARLKRQYGGNNEQMVMDSAGNTLMEMLNFLNKLPDDIGLQIEKISVNPDGVYAFSGAIKDLPAFDALREKLRENSPNLEIDRSSFEPPSGSARSFSMPLKIKQAVVGKTPVPPAAK